MANAAKAQWNPLIKPVCRYCGATDTKHHRCYECPATSSVRALFRPLLAWMEVHAPHWIHMAVAVEHPDLHVARLLFQARPFVPPPDPPCSPHRGTWTFFTDGSCSVPQNPEARHAAWAVVLDAAQAIPTMDLLLYFRATGSAPPAFLTLAQGLCPGSQNIGRAEICAILQVCYIAAKFPSVTCEVWSDSSYAIDFVGRLRGGQALVQHGSDTDLCSWSGIWTKPCNLVLRKVKAHQQSHLWDAASCRPQLGNAVADSAAKAARRRDLDLVYDLLAEVENFHILHRDMLFSYFTYQTQITKVLAKLPGVWAGVQVDPKKPRQVSQEQWLALQPSNPVLHFLPELQPPWLLFAPWPPWFLAAIWTWATRLHWPQAAGERARRHDGATNLELLANFVISERTIPPLKTDHSAWTETDAMGPDGILHSVIVKDAVMTLLAAVRYLERTTGCVLFRATRHHKIRSLEVVGSTVPRRGLCPRPVFETACQVETFELVMALLWSPSPGEALRTAAGHMLERPFDVGTPVHQRWLTCRKRI